MGNNRNRKSRLRWKPWLVTAFLLADCVGVYLVQVKLAAPVQVSTQDEALARAASVVPAWNPAAQSLAQPSAETRLALADSAVQATPYRAFATITPMPPIRFDAADRAALPPAAAPAVTVEHSGPDPVLLKLARNDIQTSQHLAQRLNFKVARDPGGTQAVGFAKAFADGTGSIDLPEPTFGNTDIAAAGTDVSQTSPSAAVAEAPGIVAPADAPSELPAMSSSAASDSAAPAISDGPALPPG